MAPASRGWFSEILRTITSCGPLSKAADEDAGDTGAQGASSSGPRAIRGASHTLTAPLCPAPGVAPPEVPVAAPEPPKTAAQTAVANSVDFAVTRVLGEEIASNAVTNALKQYEQSLRPKI